ncbi:MAG: hypothetical protein RBS56_02595 [Candidatus Gracilibacteria bacterium]|jgi:hypothetical protein|nr:hypothetical protein [Candidatus Gracilibacteria bacterium]
MFQIISRLSGGSAEHELKPDTKIAETEFSRDDEITRDPEGNWWEQQASLDAESISKLQDEFEERQMYKDLEKESLEIAKTQNQTGKEAQKVIILDAEGGLLEVPKGFGKIARCIEINEKGEKIYDTIEV